MAFSELETEGLQPLVFIPKDPKMHGLGIWDYHAMTDLDIDILVAFCFPQYLARSHEQTWRKSDPDQIP